MSNNWGGKIGSTKQFYSPQHNLIYYHTTKCALTTISTELKCIAETNCPQDAKIFAVVREPIQRFISGFFTLRTIGEKAEYRYREVKTQGFWEIIRKKPVNVAFSIYFEEFCKNGPFDSHNMSQVAFLNDDPVQPMVNFAKRSLEDIDVFLRFEHLKDDFKQKLGINLQMYKNKSKATPEEKKWCIEYAEKRENVEKLRLVLKDDFELFEKICYSYIKNELF